MGVNKGRLVGIIMSVIISLAMGIVSSALVIYTNPETLKVNSAGSIYAFNIVLSLLLGVIIALFVPLGKLGEALARKAKAAPPGIRFILINSIPVSAGSTVIISFFLSLAGVLTTRLKIPADVLAQLPPFSVMWLGSWIRLLLPTLLISYLLSVLLAPLVSGLVGLNRPAPGRPQ